MLSRDKLYEELHIQIDKVNYNKKLIIIMRDVYLKKGFSGERPSQILSNNIPIENLSDIEILMFTQTLFEGLQKLKEPIYVPSLNPELYFTDAEISRLNSFKRTDKTLKELILNNVVQIDDLHWICPFMSIEEIYKAYNSALISYNFNTQREATYKETDTGKLIRIATLNPISVRDISEDMYNDKFTPNLITLNVRLMTGKKPNINYDNANRKLYIKPDYDYGSDNTTFIDTTDGFHRINAAILAYEKAKEEGKELKGGLIVSITCMTEDEARNYIARESKRNDMSKEYTSALTNDDYNKVIRKINDYGDEKNNIFKDKIANTFNEVSYGDKYTTFEFMRDGLRETDLDIKDDFEMKMTIPKIIEIITFIIRHSMKSYYNNDLETLKKNSNLLEPTMFVGYLAIANELKNDNNYISKIPEISRRLLNISPSELKDIGLYQVKTFKAKKVYDYFKELINNI